MKTFLTAVLAVMLALTQFALAAQAGDKCAVQWGSGSWYLATIVSAVEDNYTVAYADGDKKSGVRNSEIKHLPKNPSFKTGTKVMAVWSTGALFYSGTVVEVGEKKFKVKWDDGSEPSWVEVGKILKAW
jgi:hypothetical protein